ncbi:hypothetical protein AYL99_11819 [Fonsecaea erecta]|uniref:Uncharacterized protein n=1 Tax=Fonsecaea erecta TaxID=1367422 RepID=A0A178Z2B9_9EURO|nr:hypothetical protein AYL99_11819 [Fonsecaea erecta]OAP53939.1 hypothetical protein AYL99_11819 [Fonsecaea erecta]
MANTNITTGIRTKRVTLADMVTGIAQFRSELFSMLSATEVSITVRVCRDTLTQTEMVRYLNPVRDMGIHTNTIMDLVSVGYDCILIGMDTFDIISRITSPFEYWVHSMNPKTFMFVLMIADRRTDSNWGVNEPSDVVLYDMESQTRYYKRIGSINFVEDMVGPSLMNSYSCGNTNPITLMCPNTMVSRYNNISTMVDSTALMRMDDLEFMINNMLMRTNDNTYCTGYINLTRDPFSVVRMDAFRDVDAGRRTNLFINDVRPEDTRRTSIQFICMHTSINEPDVSHRDPYMLNDIVIFSFP